MMKYVIILFVLLTSCRTAEQHLAIAKRKKPDLFQIDTLHSHDSGSVKLKEPTAEQMDVVDSLLEALMDCGKEHSVTSKSHDSSQNINNLQNNTEVQSHKQHIKDKIKELYKDKPCINPGDTLHYNVGDTFMVNIWQEGNRLRFSHYKLITTEKAIFTQTDCPAWIDDWKSIALIATSVTLFLIAAVLFLVVVIRR